MRYLAWQIKPEVNYGFLIGMKNQEDFDSAFERELREKIDQIMIDFERGDDDIHEIAVILDPDAKEPEKSDHPEFKAGGKYLYFLLVYTPEDPIKRLTEDQRVRQQEGFSRLLKNTIPELDPPVTVRSITLNDCSVEVLDPVQPVAPFGMIIKGGNELYKSKRKSIYDRRYSGRYR